MPLTHYTTPSQIKALASKVATSPDRFSFFQPKEQTHWQFYAMENKGLIQGLLGFQSRDDTLTLEFCEVGRSYQRQGVAKHLVEELVHHAAHGHQYLVVTPYEEDGVKGLQPVVRALCAQHNIPLIEEGYAADIANDPEAW